MVNNTAKKFKLKDLPSLFKSAFKEITDDYAFMFSAALAYYGIFAMPAVLFLIIYIAGLIVGEGSVQDQIMGKLSSILGEKSTEQMQTMISNTGASGENIWMTIIGAVMIIFSASAVVAHLQKALNRIWEVRIDPDAGLKITIMERLKSIGVIFSLGIFMLAFMIITSFFSGFSSAITEGMPDFMNWIFYVVNFLISFGFIWLLFALVFKIVPDVEIKYSTVWVGAAVTAFLFVVGQFLLSIYLTKSNPGESFGPAGPIIVIMIWMYYSALITLFGAEITQEYAKRFGKGIKPSTHAVKMITMQAK